MDKKTSSLKAKPVNTIGMLIGLVLTVIGAVLVAITPLSTVNSNNPYLSTVGSDGVIYAIVLAVGFVVFIAFLSLIYETRKEL